MVRETQQQSGGNIVCHKTLYRDVDEHAVCRGWFDRLAHRDPVFRLAVAMGIIVEQDELGEQHAAQ